MELRPHQVWLFLYESTESPYFHLSTETLPVEQIRDLRLLNILRLSKIKGDVGDFAFFIHSPSMKQPILLHDDNILAIWKKRCKKDTAVTIHMRIDSDEHPQDKLATSFCESLTARRQIPGGEVIEGYTMRDGPAPAKPEPRVTYREKGPCRNTRVEYKLVWTLNESWDLPKTLGERRVYIDIGEGRDRPFFAKGLVTIIRDEVLKGRCAMEVELPYCILESDGMIPPKRCARKLSAEIWEESLLRGPWKTMFDTFWDNYRCNKCTVYGFSGKGHDRLGQETAKAQLDSGRPPATCTADSGYVSEDIRAGANVELSVSPDYTT